MPGSKKDKKNGKEPGGVVAAVTKHGAKFSNGSGTKGLSSSPSPPSVLQSPEFKPVSAPLNDNPAASPLLDAISASSFATSNSLSTREWTRGIPAGMAGSPGNLISLIGESPPTAPSSYEDTRGIHSGWSSPRPAVNYHAPSVSPPTAAGRRPLSFHMEGHYSPPDVHGQIAAAVASRRSSMHSHFAQVRGVPNPPLPHQPQAHFYGSPEIDLDPQPKSGMKAGERGYYFGFDTLPTLGADYGSGKDNVVLAGYEGGMEVYLVGKRGVEHAASLKGLRGGVYQAKILPWASAGSDLFPLVAVVVHGPNLPLPAPGSNVDGDYDAVSADRSEAMANVNSDSNARESSSGRAAPGFVESYQTTVEVYSLRNSKLVSVLLEAPKIPLKTPVTSPLFQPPPPSGTFHIHADGGNVVVSSGITGECWVYRQAPISDEYPLHFRCHGKLWTTLQQPPKGDTAQEPERNRVAIPPRPRTQSAILSVSGRWIAYCPAAPSSQLALRAMVSVPAYGRAPGLSSLTPPQLPPANSDVDLPISESVVNKIMRDATQELIQGAKWVGKQSMQVWHNYWSSGQPGQQPRSPTLSPPNWGGVGTPRPEPPQFPPTHGTVTPPVAKEPGIVSILDTEQLGSSANLHPITTFSVPHGCSFLSFSPSSISLFTASSKGDVQTVWDLMRIQYTKGSPLQATGLPPSGGPRVRQVAQFSRMTVARIVDVAWTRPNGERAAMVTERGTVHLLDLPSSAFTWPPPRRKTQAQDARGAIAESTNSAVSIASNALSSVRDVARPLITRPRRSNSNAPPLAGSGIGEYATHGGKVIAASISHSLGKTGSALNQLRHTGENRVSLPSSSMSPGSSCVVWVASRKNHFLFVIGAGLVRKFPTKSRRAQVGADKRAPRLSRYRDFKLPSLPDDLLSPYVRNVLDPEEYLEFTEKNLEPGNNTMVLNSARPRMQPRDVSAESSIPQAEIESSAPYQPFYTDRRVALFEVGAPHTSLSTPESESTFGEPEPQLNRKQRERLRVFKAHQHLSIDPFRSRKTWAFGQAVNASKLDLGLPHVPDEESFNIASDDSRALPPSAMERILHRTGDDDQIVVTTRRRRGAAHSANQDDDGFFEDDCEVLDFADQRV
ncbi:hypothetical protein B0T26DRAFT_242161 [Lasiosphaeria miniovina]|uniref:Uncharacterized protein n=1 Tax=Lasiosphaeria miniovina TaxID=1954250 RepID=A0AA40AVX1_9PEZI|nr:uncharacterized protein B0T26DRAFT_242161 [Lasiosphaeria miniovina]KAK0722941.1 hypothetical protein B0T26DRAFT_242161 [Lasiosphaeria miniovina]